MIALSALLACQSRARRSARFACHPPANPAEEGLESQNLAKPLGSAAEREGEGEQFGQCSTVPEQQTKRWEGLYGSLSPRGSFVFTPLKSSSSLAGMQKACMHACTRRVAATFAPLVFVTAGGRTRCNAACIAVLDRPHEQMCGWVEGGGVGHWRGGSLSSGTSASEAVPGNFSM